MVAYRFRGKRPPVSWCGVSDPSLLIGSLYWTGSISIILPGYYINTHTCGDSLTSLSLTSITLLLISLGLSNATSGCIHVDVLFARLVQSMVG